MRKISYWSNNLPFYRGVSYVMNTLWKSVYYILIPVLLYITDACVSNRIEFDPHNKCACVCEENRANCVWKQVSGRESKNIAHKFIANKVTTKMLARRTAVIIKFLCDLPLYQTVRQTHLFSYSIFTIHGFQNGAMNTDSLRKRIKKMKKSRTKHVTFL